MKKQKRAMGWSRLGAIGLLSAMLWSAIPNAIARTYVYVSNADSQDLSVFQLDRSSGALSAVQTVAVGGAAMPMALSPDRHKLYVALRSQPYRVAYFAINPLDGKLIGLGDAPLANSMAYLSTDKTGRYLFSASYGGKLISVNPIAADGTVGAPQQSIATGPMAHSIGASPDNRYVFAAVLGADVWLRLKFDARTGQLTQEEPPAYTLPPHSGPRFYAFSPDNRFAYLIDELDGKMHVLSFNSQSGLMRHVQDVSVVPPHFSGEPWAADVHLTPDGRFLYTSERRSSTIGGFRVDRRTGKLTYIGTWPTETQPRGFNIDSTGHYLLAVGEKSAGLRVYRIGANGGLTPLGHYATGKGPNWVELVDFDD